MKTVVMSESQAQWAGNAVAVAGGWIAVRCTRVAPIYVPNANNTDGVTIPGGLLALVPDNWDTFVRDISAADAIKHLRDCVRAEDDAAEFVKTLVS